MNDTLISLSGTRWSVLSEPAVEVPWRTFDWLGSVACFGKLGKGYKFCNCNDKSRKLRATRDSDQHSRVGHARATCSGKRTHLIDALRASRDGGAAGVGP